MWAIDRLCPAASLEHFSASSLRDIKVATTTTSPPTWLRSREYRVLRTSLVAPVCVLIVLELGVDGSCAEHSTVESYTVIYAANSQSLLIIISFPSPTLSFIPDLKAFLQILPTAAFFLLLD